MLRRFAAIEKHLPNFSKNFRVCLRARYDHLPETEAFSADGLVTKEIFRRLKPSKNFNDIKEIINIFKPQQFLDIGIITTFESFVKDNDEKASTEISQCLRQCIVDTVEEYSSSLLDFRHMARDLSSTDYSGVNIVIVSPHQELIKNKDNLKIVTDGKDAKDSWKNRPAKSGHGVDENGTGNNGKDGSDGKAGKSAGNIYVVANELPPIEVSAVGGQGGEGQSGGNGAPGLDGEDGTDADRKSFEDKVKEAWLGGGSAWSYRYRRTGTDGKSGGTGGDAGTAGYHGESGDCGIVKLLPLDEDSPKVSSSSIERKPENKDGKPGTPGEAGKHGKDGVDCVLISNFIGPHRAAWTRRKISINKEYLNQLADASLSVWDTILHEIEFSQFFSTEMDRIGINTSETDVEKALLFLNRIRTELGIENHAIFLSFFQNICKKIAKARTKGIDQLNKLLGAIYHKVISFDEGCAIVSNYEYENWLKHGTEEIKFPRGFIDSQSDRSADDIVDLMINEQKNKTNTISRDILRKVADQARLYKDLAKGKTAPEGDEKSEVNREIQEILNLQSYRENPSEYVRSHLDDIIPLILYAWSVANKPQFPKDTQIVALLLFINSEGRGLLEQIRTGEGKTLIVGLTAAFFALCGNAVHVVSSNRDLAIEGEQKCRSFFQLLKLESGHICHDSDQANHQSYKLSLDAPQGSIVYGEVDNMCLDRARHVLYLSHEIQSLKWLETLFINIWIAVLRVEIKNTRDMSQHIKDTSEFMKCAVKNKMIYVPPYLHEYVDYKVNRWIDSAFQARIMREDDHFVLDIPKADGQTLQKHRAIIVLDKDTGTEQYSTRWSSGLAQFLELKYRRKLSVESLKAVFISNKAFFQRYKDCLYGLTGTLGSQNSQSFLSDLYNVQFADLPTSRKKYYYQISSKVAFEYDDWLDVIAKETIEKAKERPVLIICENVEATENIWGELIRYGVAPHTIAKYRRDGDNIEERFRKQPATAGDIIIATNKGGRGTDIHVDPSMNAKGGMHVILGYLPENVRIEEQAFGRTARNGAAGTGQFILQVKRSTYENMYDLDQYPRDIQQMKLATLSDIIIEREKINRDNKEAARLSELKKKSILRLEVEEELFDKFNEFKRKITDDVFKKLFESKPDEYKEKFAAVFQNVLKDRWAFWLDWAKEKIDSIETSGQKNSLLNEYDSSFIAKLTGTLQNSSFHCLLKNFIKKPEEAIQVGQVCLSLKEFSMAKMCFETAATYGDSSGFSRIGIAFCLINLKNGGDVKKESRRELKKAISCLESLKQTLMANLKIAEILPQSASAEMLQKVSSKENLYEDQIIGKLEVIGLHLHYLSNAVGQTVEPYDFILHQSQGEELTKEKRKERENLYKILVDRGLIQGNRRRKAFGNEAKQDIRANVDPSIAESIIHLLNSKIEFQEKDFEDIVCYNDQLWEALNIKKSEQVFILDTSRVQRVLPQEYEKIWTELEVKIKDPSNVDISVFEATSETKRFQAYLEEEKLLSRTKRAEIEQLDVESLRFGGKYEKYAKVNFNDHGNATGDLKTFLKKLKEQVISQGDKYLYQTDLPFLTKEEEAKKILMFLKDKNIIKSGGLAKYKHGDTSEDIDKFLDEILPIEFKNDKDLIKSKVLGLQGDIRSCKDIKATLKDFIDLKDQEKVPSELKFFEGVSLHKFLIIEEDKSWWDWNAFAVAMIGLAQVIGGAVLIAFGCVNIGGVLIAEGINDMVYATMAGLSGTFSWKDWAIQKAISFSISLLTCGIGKLAAMGTTVAAVGSVSITAIFTRVVKTAVFEFATTYLTKIIDEKINETMKAALIPKVVNGRTELIGGGQRTKRNYFEDAENLHDGAPKRCPSKDFPIDGKETVGTYTELNKQWKGRKGLYELNHIPPKGSYKGTPYENINPKYMPVIAMEYQHHRDYISTGRSDESNLYREEIRQHLLKGDIEGALKLELGNMLKVGPPSTYRERVAKYINFVEITPIKNNAAKGGSTYLITKQQAERLRKDLLS
ncbi:unnamed protein product [Rotaria sp. Silwood1]|nr:unnamed protein product [Rotaria sp. Silwood1]